MTSLGTFSVVARPDEVVAFRAATGLPPGAAVPATFPMRWLASPAVRDALLALAPESHLVPVHESQLFDYRGAILAGRDYDMTLAARREPAPDRLVLDGTVAEADGTTVVTVETVLRLFGDEAATA